MPENRSPGWDAKEIARIAREHYGSLREMFELHEWPERGAAMMPSVQRHVVEEYGNVQTCVEKHAAFGVALIDPPSSFSPLSEWREFLREMECSDNRDSPDFRRHILEARRMIKEKGAEGNS